jgi:hypothetical protein
MQRSRAMASNRNENRFFTNIVRGDASSFGTEGGDAYWRFVDASLIYAAGSAASVSSLVLA